MDYLDYFGLREAPFSITPDTAFYYANRTMDEALSTLSLAATTGEGFIKITGEVGTGKTLLCRRFLATLGTGWAAAYIPTPNVSGETLLTMLAGELGCRLGRGKLTEHQLVDKLNRRLVEIADAGDRAIVCIDEAQSMAIETLETIRLLTNLETEKRKLLQVVLFGQPELDDKLQRPEIRQLRQRITFEYHLEPLSKRDVNHYLTHRMIIAGYPRAELFSPNAARTIHRASGGVPRLVNILAHKTLLLAYGRGKREVGWKEAREAVRDTPSAVRSVWRWLGLGAMTAMAILPQAFLFLPGTGLA